MVVICFHLFEFKCQIFVFVHKGYFFINIIPNLYTSLNIVTKTHLIYSSRSSNASTIKFTVIELTIIYNLFLCDK